MDKEAMALYRQHGSRTQVKLPLCSPQSLTRFLAALPSHPTEDPWGDGPDLPTLTFLAQLPEQVSGGL